MTSKIEVFSTANCGYCERAKSLLRRKGLNFTDLDIEAEDINRLRLRERLPRVRSLPQIFINGLHIGSFEDLEIIHQNGRLDAMTSP